MFVGVDHGVGEGVGDVALIVGEGVGGLVKESVLSCLLELVMESLKE